MNQRQLGTTSYPISILMIDETNHLDGKTGLSPIVTISKNGGSFSNAAGSVSEIGNGWYGLAGNATDRNTLGELIIHAEAAGADKFDSRYVVVPWNPFDSNLGMDVYHADIQFNKDTDDEYTVTWFKNATRITTGITSPTIQVIKRSDGTDLITSTSMTEIGTTESFKYNEATNKQISGESYLVICSGNIDGSGRSYSWILGRDS